MAPEDADIGTDVDVAKIMESVRAEVARKKSEGLYPRDVLLDIESSNQEDLLPSETGLDAAIAELRLSSEFSAEVGTASSKRYIAPAVERFKSVIQSTVKWYVGAVLDQIRLFSENSVQTISIMARRLQAMESKLRDLEDEIEALKSKNV